MAPLFKLLNVLAQNYKVNLLKNQVVESIFAPLRQLESSSYFKLPLGDINMYLECLTTLSTLLECNIFETKTNLFREKNIQFLVAMSIKHGNTGKIAIEQHRLSVKCGLNRITNNKFFLTYFRSMLFGIVADEAIFKTEDFRGLCAKFRQLHWLDSILISYSFSDYFGKE